MSNENKKTDELTNKSVNFNNIDNSEYDASKLSVLKGLDPVRKRPAMYIDSTDKKGMHHLVWEMLDNAVDENLAGNCSKIEIIMNPEGYPNRSIEIKDNGRGIPFDMHPEEGISGIEIVFTKLHGGGKFDNNSYKTSGGLHGVGAAVTNALSELLEVIVVKNGVKAKQTFSKGITKQNLTILEENCKEPNGTSIIFKPDPEIFKGAIEECNLEFDYNLIKTRMRNTAFLNRGLKLTLTNNKDSMSETFYSEDGIVDIVRENIKEEENLINPEIIFIENEVESDDEYGQFMSVEVAFAAEMKNYTTNIKTFVNNINTIDGGKHLIGFRMALKNLVHKYGKEILDIHEKLEFEDILEGCSFVISLRMGDPEFGGQTKSSLTSSEAQSYVHKVTKEYLENYFEMNPEFAKRFVNKAVLAKMAREKGEKLKSQTRKELVSNPLGALPGKLANCITKDPEKAELFIVEGDSAGGSAKQGRDRNNQAILPLKGKILNTQKAEESKILKSEEIRNVVVALGTDFGNNFNIEKLNYKKIIMLMDADVDGSHIAILLLTMFNSKLRPLIEAGYVYMARPPLYVATSKKGNTKKYFLDEKELNDEYPNGIPQNVDVSRFKGLGEMDPKQLWETTMNPDTRILERVTIDDVEEAQQIVEDLMGDFVAPRKKYLEENADLAELDI